VVRVEKPCSLQATGTGDDDGEGDDDGIENHLRPLHPLPRARRPRDVLVNYMNYE
jgi:hypothetical protein